MSKQNPVMKPKAEAKASRYELSAMRLCRVMELRETQNKTFREIGRELGCTSNRARKLYVRAKAHREYHAAGESGDPHFGLSVRAANGCRNRNLMSREQIAAAIKDGTLHPSHPRCRNFGWKSYKEIHEWLGLHQPGALR